MGKGRRYSQRSIHKVVHNAIIKAGLDNKDYSVHTIRHSFAAHLVDNATDLHTVKELLGHNSLATTMQYLHLSHKRMQGVVNPFDMLPINVCGPLDHTNKERLEFSVSCESHEQSI